MKRLVRWALICLASVGLSSVAAASNQPMTDAEKSQILEPLSSPDATPSAVPSFSNAASIQAGTSDTKASLTFAGYVPHTPLGNYMHYQIGGEAPVSTKGSTDEVDIGTVSGLTAGASAHADLSAMWWPHQSQPQADALDMACRQHFFELLDPKIPLDQVGWIVNTDYSCDRSLFTKDKLQKIVDSLNTTLDQCRALTIKTEALELQMQEAAEATKTDPAKGAATKPKATDSEGVTDAQKQQQCNKLLPYIPHVTAASGRRVIDPNAKIKLVAGAADPATLKKLTAEVDTLERASSRVTFLTLGTKVNRQKVSYFNTNDLTTLIKDHTTGYGVNLTLSQIRYNTLIAGGFSYEKTYKSTDAVQVCSPVKGSTSLECPSGSIGAPKQLYSRILFTEARVLIKTGVFAVAPRLEYDFNTSTFAAKLPLYFAPDDKKALTGGITLGYVTHGDGFGVAVFVNKAFSFY